MTVILDLTWLTSVIPWSTGICLIDAGIWSDYEADFVAWTDASLKLVAAFVYTGSTFVYPLKSPPVDSKDKIDIFLELLVILSAIFHVASFILPDAC